MRLHDSPIPIIGLTGGIATGKSTVSKMLRDKGLFIIDADQLVKEIYKQDETKKFIATLSSQVIKGGEIDFNKLREIFFRESAIKTAVEDFIYLRLPDQFKEKLKEAGKAAFVVYDVPLLFEKELDKKVDKTVVVYAPRKIQLARLMKRDGHLEEMAKNVLNHQMDIEEKKKKANIVVDNSGSLEELAGEVKKLLQLLAVN